MIACADQIKSDTPSAIQTLQKLGKRIIMLTGDHHTTAQAVASRIGVDDVIAEVLYGESAVAEESADQAAWPRAFSGSSAR